MADPQSSEKPQQQDDNNEDQTWVLDSLVGFLKSPLWSTSLNDFTDRNSIVFDPDDIEDQDGNVRHRQEYELIFRQYRKLVDRLIGSHMLELGINEQQFARACQMAEGLLATKLKRILFEELWAAENYEVFVRLMAKRNVELQLEALEMLVQKYGLVYDVFVPIGTSPKNFLSEEHVLREAILRSLDDMVLDQDQQQQQQQPILGGEEQILYQKKDKILQQSKTSVQVDIETKTDESVGPQEEEEEDTTDKETVQRDAARLVEVKQKIDQKMNEALQTAMLMKTSSTTNNDDDDEISDDGDEEAEEEEANLNDESSDQLSDVLVKSKLEPSTTTINNNKTKRRLSIEEIHQRADYLRLQRDKILQKRKKERNERISKYLIKEKNQSNHQTDDHQSSTIKENQEDQPEDQPDQQQKVIAFRKTLAQRLKSEVVFGGNPQQQQQTSQ